MLRVKEGKAAYERDSVLFEKIDYPFPVIAGLLCAAVVNNGELSVLDFGGSLGSSYYQCRGLLGEIKKLKWSIVEQPKFCSCGKEFFENGELKFYDDMDEYLRNDDPNVAIFSGVIQYIKSPYNLLETTIEKKFRYIIFDRTPFYNKTNETIMVQHVPEQIYKASYPFTIFSLNKFRKVFAQKYEEIAYFDSLEFPALKRFSAKYSGFIFRRIQ